MMTNDVKEDWRADRGTPSMRAQPELVSEFLDVTGQRLIMELVCLFEVAILALRASSDRA